MKKIEEEVPTTNISGGAIADPQNRKLGEPAKIKGQKKLETEKTLGLFKRWRQAAEAP